MAVKLPSAAVLAGRQRRSLAARTATAGKQVVRIEWFIKNVTNKINLTMKKRVRIATSLVKNRVIQNISVAVTKSKGPRGGMVVTDRSKPGEFPRADTTQLLKTIFDGMSRDSLGDFGFVATPLDYGLLLEIQMNRSFLVRTRNEELNNIKRILTVPILRFKR